MKKAFRENEVMVEVCISEEQARQVIGKENFPIVKKLMKDYEPMIRHKIKETRLKFLSLDGEFNSVMKMMTDEKLVIESTESVIISEAVRRAIQEYLRSGGTIDIKQQAVKEITPELAEDVIKEYESSLEESMLHFCIGQELTELLAEIFRNN